MKDMLSETKLEQNCAYMNLDNTPIIKTEYARYFPENCTETPAKKCTVPLLYTVVSCIIAPRTDGGDKLHQFRNAGRTAFNVAAHAVLTSTAILLIGASG